MPADLAIERPEELTELVHLNDPAILVFTDFCRVHAVTITADKTIDYALEQMKNSDIRLLLVVDKKKHMIGLINAYRILGAEPVKLGEASRMVRSQIKVAMLMEPRNRIKVLDMSHLRDAKVGHIIATLHSIDEYYLLVVEENIIRGLFSVSQISKQLGRGIIDLQEPAHSLAGLIRAIG
jgi:CBS-domain-containing membrane protein